MRYLSIKEPTITNSDNSLTVLEQFERIDKAFQNELFHRGSACEPIQQADVDCDAVVQKIIEDRKNYLEAEIMSLQKRYDELHEIIENQTDLDDNESLNTFYTTDKEDTLSYWMRKILFSPFRKEKNQQKTIKGDNNAAINRTDYHTTQEDIEDGEQQLSKSS